MINILENLNPQQKDAVLTTDGPVLVIAGPGSGKTRVLTHRIVHIVSIKKSRPENILAVTFTNKAALEMKKRVMDLSKKISEEDGRQNSKRNYDSYKTLFPTNFPTICTFHSLCVKILREEAELIGYKKNFVIFDADDQKSLIKKIMKRLEINDEQFNPRAVLAEIGNAKNTLITPQKYESLADGFFQETVSKIYFEYQKELKQTVSFDFDDLIMQTIVLFVNHAKVLEKYQDRFHYIMVDEYQDTNHAQYKIIYMLSRKYNNIFVVGDDWQSIYKWRGADLQNILEFEKNYPGAKTILLEQNYRSTQEILDVSYGIISKNINRKEKNLFSSKKSGQPVVVYEAADEKGEAEFVVSEIAKLNAKEGLKLKEIAILYRTNAQSRSIEETFLQFNVPYKIVGGIKFYMRKEIKDLIAYFRLIQNNSDLLSFERIINIPKRGLGKTTYEKILKQARIMQSNVLDTIFNYESGDISKKRMEKLISFARMIQKCKEKSKEMKIGLLLDYLLKEIDYKNYIIDGTEEGEQRWENVKELFTALEKYDKMKAEEAMKFFIEEVALASDLDLVDESQDSVTLMTLHSAKGLEYDTVFIIGLEEGLLPHSMSMDSPADIEEERRLCYVGVTRAKNRVNLVFARVRRIFGSVQANDPSRFLADIPAQLVDMKNQGYSFLGDGSEKENDIFYD